MPTLNYSAGTLLFEPDAAAEHTVELGFEFDKRTHQYRAPGFRYRDIVLRALDLKIALIDRARAYHSATFKLESAIVPRPHQSEALQAWIAQGSRGVVALPTGSGKTILAVMAIEKTQRPTLVVVPTIDLLLQWQKVLSQYFNSPVGALGGGQKDLQTLTVATYDSAYLMIEQIGNRFGLLIFDECHHLPSPQYQLIAKSALAPFRLGLSATLQRNDGRESVIFDLLGPLCFEMQINQMVTSVLSPYDVVSIEVPLTEAEKQDYEQARALYTRFIRQQRIDFSSPDGWQQFIRKTATVAGGREAMEAWRAQKRLSQAASGKLDELWRILAHHSSERIIIFTQDNAMAYLIGRSFILPVLTHLTKPKERKLMLESFRNGILDVLVTSKVLNEGVDVPEASVGVVISGSGTVREHVQRLGRILRHQEGKRAMLYEVISQGTNEYYVNKRRRNHDAYQRPAQIYKT